MASLSSLSTELKLYIVDHVCARVDPFLPVPNPDMSSLSRVNKTFRSLILPRLYEKISLLNDEHCGSLVTSLIDSPHAALVKSLHYIGIEDLEEEEEPKTLAEPVIHVLSNLAEWPNLEKITVEFRAAKTKEENDEKFEERFYYFEVLDEGDETSELEETEAFRSMMNQSYAALAQNSPAVFKHLELKRVVSKPCSTWRTYEFQTILNELPSFTLSLRDGNNGADSGWNTLEGYQDYVKSLDTYFFQHLNQAENFNFSANTGGPPGLSGICHIPFPLNAEHMPKLQRLELRDVFIGQYLSNFIVAHQGTLNAVKLESCYAGLGCDSAQNATSWADMLLSVQTEDVSALRSFTIISIAEDLRPEQGRYDDTIFTYENVVRAQQLREKIPSRRMFEYGQLDMKYGWFYHNMDITFARFEEGEDQAAWEALLRWLPSHE